jgi:hypothetical protein
MVSGRRRDFLKTVGSFGFFYLFQGPIEIGDLIHSTESAKDIARRENLPVVVKVVVGSRQVRASEQTERKIGKIISDLTATGELHSFQETQFGFEYKFKSFDNYCVWGNRMISDCGFSDKMSSRFSLGSNSTHGRHLIRTISLAKIS